MADLQVGKDQGGYQARMLGRDQGEFQGKDLEKDQDEDLQEVEVLSWLSDEEHLVRGAATAIATANDGARSAATATTNARVGRPPG
ncbi:hypothetical protein AKJ16_DCAP07251 [Drosera capensis]